MPSVIKLKQEGFDSNEPFSRTIIAAIFALRTAGLAHSNLTFVPKVLYGSHRIYQR